MHFIYFPYLDLGDLDEIVFSDDLKVWNFDKKSSDYISNQKVIDKIKQISSSTIVKGRPIKNFGVFFVGDENFGTPESHKQFGKATEMKWLMFLAFMASQNAKGGDRNAGWSMTTSECFIPIIQNFQLDSDHISERTGYVIDIQIGGYKIGEYQFKAPSHLNQPHRLIFDKLLLRTLLKVRKRKKRLYQRILRATDFIFQSYYNSQDVSENARILLEAAAFETLLVLNGDARKGYKAWIQSNFAKKTKKVRFSSERRNGTAIEIDTWQVFWADRFFTLRNHIIHGSKLSEDGFYFGNQRHFDLALTFFVLTLKKILNHELKSDIFIDHLSWDRKNKKFIYEDNDLERRIMLAIQAQQRRRKRK